MNMQKFQSQLTKIRDRITDLFQKAKDESEYRRVAIALLVALIAIIVFLPIFGAVLIVATVWYVTY